MSDKILNPKTNRYIKIHGSVYNKLIKEGYIVSDGKFVLSNIPVQEKENTESYQKIKLRKELDNKKIQGKKASLILNKKYTNILDIKTLNENQQIDNIIHISDVHIPLKLHIRRKAEYELVFKRVIESIKDIPNKIIALCGDIFHTKIHMEPETILISRQFIKELSQLATVLIITGNHDFNLNFRGSCDNIDSIIGDIDNVYYLKYSGGYCIGKIVFVVWSFHDNIIIKDFDKNDQYKYYLLYHETVTKDGKFHNMKCMNQNEFKDFDGVLLGHLHKHHDIIPNKISYSGSLIQQNYGEDYEGHGYIIWDTQRGINKFIEIKNDYGFLTLSPNNVNDIKDIPPNANIRCIFDNIDKEEQDKILNKLNEYNPSEIKKICKVRNDIRTTNVVIENMLNTKELQDLYKRYSETYPKQEDIQSHWYIMSIEFMNVFSYKNDIVHTINFKDGINLISGLNASGKTSILNMVLWCLGNSAMKKTNILNRESSTGYIKLFIHMNNNVYEIYKILSGNTYTIKLFKDKENITEPTIRKTNNLIKNMFGSYADIYKYNVISSRNLESSCPMYMSQAEFDKTFKHFCNIDHYTTWSKLAKTELNTTKKNILVAETELKTLLSTIGEVPQIDISQYNTKLEIRNKYPVDFDKKYIKENYTYSDEINRDIIYKIIRLEGKIRDRKCIVDTSVSKGIKELYQKYIPICDTKPVIGDKIYPEKECENISIIRNEYKKLQKYENISTYTVYKNIDHKIIDKPFLPHDESFTQFNDVYNESFNEHEYKIYEQVDKPKYHIDVKDDDIKFDISLFINYDHEPEIIYKDFNIVDELDINLIHEKHQQLKSIGNIIDGNSIPKTDIDVCEPSNTIHMQAFNLIKNPINYNIHIDNGCEYEDGYHDMKYSIKRYHILKEKNMIPYNEVDISICKQPTDVVYNTPKPEYTNFTDLSYEIDHYMKPSEYSSNYNEKYVTIDTPIRRNLHHIDMKLYQSLQKESEEAKHVYSCISNLEKYDSLIDKNLYVSIHNLLSKIVKSKLNYHNMYENMTKLLQENEEIKKHNQYVTDVENTKYQYYLYKIDIKRTKLMNDLERYKKYALYREYLSNHIIRKYNKFANEHNTTMMKIEKARYMHTMSYMTNSTFNYRRKLYEIQQKDIEFNKRQIAIKSVKYCYMIYYRRKVIAYQNYMKYLQTRINHAKHYMAVKYYQDKLNSYQGIIDLHNAFVNNRQIDAYTRFLEGKKYEEQYYNYIYTKLQKYLDIYTSMYHSSMRLDTELVDLRDKLYRYESYKKNIDRINNIRNTISTLSMLRDTQSKFVEILQIIPKKIEMNYIGTVNTHMNNILSRFISYNAKFTYNDKGKLSFLINDGNILPINLSGYENLIFRIAINNGLSAGNVDLLMIDEAFDCIDEKNYSNINKLLEYLRETYKVVLLISHRSIDECENTIYVKKMDNNSSIYC